MKGTASHLLEFLEGARKRFIIPVYHGKTTCISSFALSRQKSSLTCQSHLNWKKVGKEKTIRHNVRLCVKPLPMLSSTAI